MIFTIIRRVKAAYAVQSDSKKNKEIKSIENYSNEQVLIYKCYYVITLDAGLNHMCKSN